MNGLLAGLWAASLSSAVMIPAILLLRALFQNRTPRLIFDLLWDAALARLLILAALPSPVSVWQWLPAAPQKADPHPALPPDFTVSAGKTLLEGTAVQPDTAALSALPNMNTILTAIWLTGALTLAARFLWNHRRSRRLYADSLPCKDAFVQSWLKTHPLHRRIQIRTSDRISAPLTYGVLRPVILLPSGVEWPDKTALSFILEHEYQHIRRFDTLKKSFLAAAVCLHWFNPFVWVMAVLSDRDIELACDEAVTAQSADRAGYAQTLLNMEEQRSRWEFSSCRFSQNALEERIRSIMKHKRISTAALIVILGTMSITTAMFASAAPESKAGTSSGKNAPESGYVYNHFQAVEGDIMILSKGGEDGEKQYSADGGRTWLSEKDYRAEFGGSDWQVEWWTAEDYARWLEEEKQLLQSIIGERGYTGSEGWFTWDQKRVDETIALYERILADIKNGALYSKTITDKNGGAVEDTMLGSGTLAAAETFTLDEKDAVAPKAVDADALLEELKPFGFGGSANLLTYNGQLIRYLVDGVALGDSGYSIQYVYSNPDGAVDVHTLRSVIRNPDGSYDPMGELIGAAAAGDPNFDQGLIESAAFSGGAQATTAEGTDGNGGISFEEIFARYQSYGLSYSPREGSMGSLSWNGQAVKSFADQKPDGSVFSYQDPYAESGLQVYVQYDANGHLTGLHTK